MTTTITLFPLHNYTISQKASQLEEDPSVNTRLHRLQKDYEVHGMRRTVEGLKLVHENDHPHVLLLQVANAFFKLPGDYLRPGEGDIPGLQAQLHHRLDPEPPIPNSAFYDGDDDQKNGPPTTTPVRQSEAVPESWIDRENEGIESAETEKEMGTQKEKAKDEQEGGGGAKEEADNSFGSDEVSYAEAIAQDSSAPFKSFLDASSGGEKLSESTGNDDKEESASGEVNIGGPPFTVQSRAEDWEIGELLGQSWRPNFEGFMYPYIPGHISSPKEVKSIYLVHLPEHKVLAVPKNMKLVAIPLFELYDNSVRYGPLLAAVPHLLSKYNFEYRS